MSLRLQETDKVLFKELYSLRVLTAAQIAAGYYYTRYGYRRIRALLKDGYLDSTPFVIGKKKITQYYYLTKKSIDTLSLEQPKPPSKLLPQNKILIERQLNINEVPLKLRLIQTFQGKDVWQWMGSIEAKKKYNIYSRDKISGVLYNTLTKESYGVYVLIIPRYLKENNPMSKKDERKRYVSMANEISEEISRHSRLENNIIFADSLEALTIFRVHANPQGRKLLTFNINYGINLVYNMLSEKEQLRKLCAEATGVGHESIIESSQMFADFEDKNMFYTELITNDMVKLNYMADYLKVTGTRNQKPIKVICWDAQTNKTLSMFKFLKDPRIKFAEISWADSDLKESPEPLLLNDQTKPPSRSGYKQLSFTLSPESIAKIMSVEEGKRSSVIDKLIRSAEF